MYPVPFRWWFDFVSPNDLLVRAHLRSIRGVINSFLIRRFPLILNSRLIDYLNQTWKGKKLVISGRCLRGDQKAALRAIAGILRPDGIVFREHCSEHEEKYKERVLRERGVDLYIEDRPFVRDYLTAHCRARVLGPQEFWTWAREDARAEVTARDISTLEMGRKE